MSSQPEPAAGFAQKVGIWTFQFDRQPIGAAIDAARQLEEVGFTHLWIPEQKGREAMTLASLLLCGTDQITIATGIARASARDARSTAAGHRTLTEAFPGRFILGLGAANRLGGQESPLQAMRSYLDDMASATYSPPAPAETPRVILAAINDKMLDLAAERTGGAHTYLCPPAHTRMARERMGPDAFLAPEQLVVLEDHAPTARRIARRHLSFYLALPHYQRNFKRFGFTDSDFEDGGSDRIIDTILAQGSLQDVRSRIGEHVEAGADQVCLQVLAEDPDEMPLKQWEALAEELLG